MENPRKYGPSPFSIAVVHGGPGAAGEMAPLARHLAREHGVLEPLQTADSLDGQVEELKTLLTDYGQPPCVLIGFSWGAWLSFMVSAFYPKLVKKLILVCSGPFEEKYAADIDQVRLARLGMIEQQEAHSLIEILQSPAPCREKNQAFVQLGHLIATADAYDPVPEKSGLLDCRFDIFQKVWQQGAELRKSGQLLQLGKNIQAPVTAIHGDYDPHPAVGVREPLSSILKDFRFLLLENCGHRPWMERQARDDFFGILKKEL